MIRNLLQPYLDLGTSDRGPIFAEGIQHYWAAFQDAEAPRFALQRTLPPAFRTIALTEMGCADHIVDDPRDLPQNLRTPKWQLLCRALDQWPDLPEIAQSRLGLLLHALCFYQLINRLVPTLEDTSHIDNPYLADLAYTRASASYVLSLPNRVSDYGNADLSRFVLISDADGVHPQIGFNAAIKVFTHIAKTSASLDDLREWEAKAAHFLHLIGDCEVEFDYLLSASRFYRATAFVPMFAGDRADVVRQMDQATEFAQALKPETAAQDVLRRENLHPLLESRTKEAIWLGDLQAALGYAEQVTQLDPFEARGWLELGDVFMKLGQWGKALDAYLTSATIGPPATAIAQHMAGLCLLEMGQASAAAYLFKSAIEADPGAVSTRNQIRNLPDTQVISELKRWNLQTFGF